MRAALRLLGEHEARRNRLRRAVVEGEASGAPEPFDGESFLAHKRRDRA